MSVARIFILALVASVLAGCAAGPKNMTPPSGFLEPQIIPKFSDIPVPAGFKLVTKESYSFENAGVRVAILKYQGRASPDEVITFYKEQMPMYNWNFLNVIEYQERLLNFDRENQTCNITVNARGQNVAIRITVGPKPANASKKDKTLLK